MKHTCALLAVLVGFLAAFPAAALSAEIPYKSYTYDADDWDEQPSPPLYLPERAQRGAFASPTDICVYDGGLYVLDGGDVIITDPQLNETGRILLTASGGERFAPGEPGGLHVRETGIYVSDLSAERVCRFDFDGRLELTISKPASEIYDQSVPFRAKRILADGAGNVYALVDGLYSGAALFSAQGEFLGFYGANKIEMTAAMWVDQMWKRLLSREQRDAMTRFVPTAYSGFDIDADNFIYTCSQSAQSVSSRVRKLNPTGDSLWNDRKLYGDYMPAGREAEGLSGNTLPVDVDIAPDGVLSVLDASKGRVFQYDATGVMMGAFGGKGAQDGVFESPAAIAGLGERLYVLDKSDGSITAFALTEYGRAYRAAAVLYNDGEYREAMPYWREVLRRNGYSQAAYAGIGKALYAQGDVAAALSYLKKSGDRAEYSRVFANVRMDFIRNHFTYIAVIITVLSGLVVFGRRMPVPAALAGLKKHVRVVTHPLAGMEALLETRGLSLVLSASLVILWFLLHVLTFFGEGFIFNARRPEDFNALVSAAFTAGVFLLWVTANWGVSVLTDGKATARMIFCVSAYALVPLLLTQSAALVMSRVMIAEEAAFISWVTAAGVAWAALVLFCVVMEAHQFSFEKTAANIVLSALGMLTVIFLLFVAVVLFRHVANLIGVVYKEVTLRR